MCVCVGGGSEIYIFSCYSFYQFRQNCVFVVANVNIFCFANLTVHVMHEKLKKKSVEIIIILGSNIMH